jgi:hypothetical protein
MRNLQLYQSQCRKVLCRRAKRRQKITFSELAKALDLGSPRQKWGTLLLPLFKSETKKTGADLTLIVVYQVGPAKGLCRYFSNVRGGVPPGTTMLDPRDPEQVAAYERALEWVFDVYSKRRTERRREIIDRIVFNSSGRLYGDDRDQPWSDCDVSYVEDWHGFHYTARLRRARLEQLSDEELLNEAQRLYENERQIVACFPRKRGRPKGAGSFTQVDGLLLREVRELRDGGLSLHAASQIVASRAAGSSTLTSKARRLARRLLEKKSS